MRQNIDAIFEFADNLQTILEKEISQIAVD